MWENGEKYVVKAKSKDINGEESDWSSLSISMPKAEILEIIFKIFNRIKLPFINIINQIFKVKFKQKY